MEDIKEPIGVLWSKFGEAGQRPQHDLNKALYRIIEIKDMKTATHCKAVARYSRLVAERMGVEQPELDLIWDAGLLHDIGKILVDNTIIYKRTELKRNEIFQLQKHPEIGMSILEAFHLNDSIVDAAWHHHERWDGRGYPEGIGGDEIRFLTQIIAVSDAVDAMSTNRAYRKALTFEEILSELKNGAGKQYNPEIVTVFIEMLLTKEIMILG
jgi:putative nucleotidyltransferase with HDIG domain